MSIQVREVTPSAALQPYVENYWQAVFNPASSQVLSFKVVPRGVIELVLHLSDFHCDLEINEEWTQSPDHTLIGLWTEPYEVRFRKKVEVQGIRFKPDGFYALFGIPAAEFSRRSTDMEDVLGEAFCEYVGRLREALSAQERLRLTESFLLKMLQKNDGAAPYLHAAAELIRTQSENISVDQLSQKVFISPRQLEREFKTVIGISPKAYLRIARLHQAQQLLRQNRFANLAQLAYQCGYYDQSHFIRDFKKILGVVPTSFLEQQAHFI